MPSATPTERRRRLEELLIQRVLARLGRQSIVDPVAGAPTLVVREAIIGRLREVTLIGTVVSEKQLAEISDSISRDYPRIAEAVQSPRGSPTRKAAAQPTVSSAALNGSTRSALLFPPLQTHSPRSRTLMVPHPPGSAVTSDVSPQQQVPSPRAPIRALPTPPSSYPKPPYALDEQSLNRPATNQIAPRRHLTSGSANNHDFDLGSDGDALSGSRTSRPPRRPREDVWSQIALLDQEKFKGEIAERHHELRQQRETHSDFLRSQVEGKKIASEREKLQEAQVQRRVDDYLAQQNEKRLAEEAQRKARDEEVKREIQRQVSDAAARKERQRLRAEMEGRALKAKYDQALEEEKKTIDGRRWQAFLVQQESLQYNELLEKLKAEQKLKDLELDKAAMKVQEEQAAIAEARRIAHQEKIKQKASRAKLMAASLQASAEEQARAAVERAEREAAAKRAEEDRLAELKAAKKKVESNAVRQELERQMVHRRAAMAEEQARDAAIAAQLREKDARALEEAQRRAVARKQLAEQHRHEIEHQIAEREQREREPLGLTATERSLNRHIVAQLQTRATPAVAW